MTLLPFQITASRLTAAQDEATALWHTAEPPIPAESSIDTPELLALRLHRANFDLWHEEDKARDPRPPPRPSLRSSTTSTASTSSATTWCRASTSFCSTCCSAASLPNPQAPLNSETPGLMLDRLSILALKIYHTQEEIERGQREHVPHMHSRAQPRSGSH